MSVFVIDASVAAKWVLPGGDEPLQDEAFALLRRYTAGQAVFIVPDLFWAELGSILWKCVRSGRITREAAIEGVSVLRELGLRTVGMEDLLETALLIGLGTGRTVYDSLYVAAAHSRDGMFLTADERLVNALGARFPVKWLGAVS